jgi:hypothetical protein
VTDPTWPVTALEGSARAGPLAGTRDRSQLAGMVDSPVAAKDASVWMVHFCIRLPYRQQGDAAQQASWGLGAPRQSMPYEIGLAVG